MLSPEDTLTWGILVFLGTGACSVFYGSWKLFNIRKDDHDKIAKDIAKVKSDLTEVIVKDREALTERLDSKFESTVSAIGRVESNSKEDYAILHGRVNKNVDELGEVEGKVEYQRGVTDTMKDFILNNKGN